MFFLLALVLIILLYLFITRNHNYWKNKNVVHDKPVPFFGNIARQIFMQINNSDLYVETYRKYPEEKYIGFYEGNKVAIILRDPELVKIVLQQDFNNFYARGFKCHKDTTETLMRNMFTADGDLWKMVRQNLTSVFSGSKLKAMSPIIVEKAEKLQDKLLEIGPDGKNLDVKDMMARYTIDVIGACGFGIDIDSLTDETSLFRKMGNRLLTAKPRDVFVFLLKMLSPGIFKNINTFPPEVEADIVCILRSVMKQRNYLPSPRNDFIDCLLELNMKGKQTVTSLEKKYTDGSPMTVELEFDELTMAAQVFVFFGAGFETSSSAASFTLHQLAFYPDIQKKCQDEIDEVFKRYDNKLSYDLIKDLKYLEMCVKETLRLYPALGFITRLSAEKYTFPGTDLTIDEGVSVVIPIQAFHSDKQYFEDPNEFKPERFHPDNVNDINPFTYIPFGGGPRACIGKRLGITQTLIGLVAVLSKYSVKPCGNSIKFPDHDPSSNIVQGIKGGLPLLVVPRK